MSSQFEKAENGEIAQVNALPPRQALGSSNARFRKFGNPGPLYVDVESPFFARRCLIPFRTQWTFCLRFDHSYVIVVQRHRAGHPRTQRSRRHGAVRRGARPAARGHVGICWR